MAILLRGMEPDELASWTQAMIDSGERIDLSSAPAHGRQALDGRRGDKVSLPLVPMVAACGAAVPQLSGRGLGHTGGTLDKLDAIPDGRPRSRMTRWSPSCGRRGRDLRRQRDAVPR